MNPMHYIRQQWVADVAIGAATLVLGVLAIDGAFHVQRISDEGMASYVFPLLIGILLAVAGAVLCLIALHHRDRAEVQWPNRDGAIRIGVILASLGIYIAVIPLIGFVTSSGLMLAFHMWYLGRDRWYLTVAAGVLTAVVIYFMFIKILGLVLPRGILM